MFFKYVEIRTERHCHGAHNARKTMTVRELKNVLENFDENLPVILSNDKGWTYGRIKPESVYASECFYDEDEEEE